MSTSRKDFLKNITVKTEKVKLLSLEGVEFEIKELTIAETKEFNEILKTKTQQEAIYYACKCSMIEPSFFTDEELATLNKAGEVVIMEIYSKIPLIGKTEEEKEKYFEMLNEAIENDTKKIEETKEEKEKK